MRHVVVLSALIGVLALPGSAHGGGWATIGFAPLPDAMISGETWKPEITVLQHGRTPLGGLTPVVSIRDVDSGEEAAFTATETATTGVYRADVVFPSGGDWRVTVESGFVGEGGTVTYGPVSISLAPPSAAPSSFPALPVAAAATLLVFAAAAAIGVLRTRRLTAASR